ncbi:MAG: sigma-54-dependent Fis family transcriptional regulator [Desulfuromonas sp.]|nr:sigma-54-dependent Fis family transcriptional regulator [Desulfuromonas sp.]
MSQPRILVVDDDTSCESLKQIFQHEGYQVITTTSGHTALNEIKNGNFTIVINNLNVPGTEGTQLLKSIKDLQAEIQVIITTACATIETAVDAIKNGAFDYLPKPFTPDQIKDLVTKAARQYKANGIRNLSSSGAQLNERPGSPHFVGDSKAMQKVYARILQVAPTNSTVLITGESGTGKELAARTIHENSTRKDMPFVAIDCTVLAENLLENELFGHEKGAFTGATQTKDGLFKVANGGTLFLDEISNISLSSQAKLLRVIQERVVTPIGSTKPLPIDIRLISATNKKLREISDRGEFRKALYSRLNTIPIDMPPLRERSADLPLLIGFFLRKFADKINKEIKGISPAAMNQLEEYNFPGNVRELEHIMERAIVLAPEEFIMPGDLDLPPPTTANKEYVPATTEELKVVKRRLREEAVKPVEKCFVIEAFKRNSWNITRAAEDVGMLRPNFQALMKKLRISARERKVV